MDESTIDGTKKAQRISALQLLLVFRTRVFAHYSRFHTKHYGYNTNLMLCGSFFRYFSLPKIADYEIDVQKFVHKNVTDGAQGCQDTELKLEQNRYASLNKINTGSL